MRHKLGWLASSKIPPAQMTALIQLQESVIERAAKAPKLTAIEAEADRLVASQEEVWRELREALAAEDVIFIGQEPLDETAEAWLDRYFREQIFPLLTPQAIDPAHPFPFIPNRGFSLIFELKRGKVHIRELIMLPAGVPRFIRIPGGTKHWSGGDAKEGALFYEEGQGKFDLIPAK